MKKIILPCIIMFLFFTNAFSQMQKGDKAIGFNLFVQSSDGMTVGNFNGSYAQNVSDHIRLTFGPGFTISTAPGTGTIDPVTYEYTPGENEVTLLFTFSMDGLYYFSNKARLSPFAGVGWYVSKDFFMLDFPIGVNYFISKNISWNSSLRLGVGTTSTEYNGTTTSESSFSMLLTTGLEFKF